MLIVCWNVAGLSTTVNRIHSFYGNQEGNNSKRKTSQKSNVVLAEYMKRHGADIFCVQEHKIPLSQLSTRSEPRGCSDIEGYESFWSCCVDQKKKGLNGVVTYVKKGVVPVYRANARPLGSADLDDQGRCVMTDHVSVAFESSSS
jgi:exonuclease III